jgi:hypothetical protein
MFRVRRTYRPDISTAPLVRGTARTLMQDRSELSRWRRCRVNAFSPDRELCTSCVAGCASAMMISHSQGGVFRCSREAGILAVLAFDLPPVSQAYTGISNIELSLRPGVNPKRETLVFFTAAESVPDMCATFTNRGLNRSPRRALWGRRACMHPPRAGGLGVGLLPPRSVRRLARHVRRQPNQPPISHAPMNSGPIASAIAMTRSIAKRVVSLIGLAGSRELRQGIPAVR